jgi:hypothetical protein
VRNGCVLGENRVCFSFTHHQKQETMRRRRRRRRRKAKKATELNGITEEEKT